MTVDDETTIEDVTEALGYLNADAKECQQVVGNDTWESPWDKVHGRINDMLDKWESLR